jgi:nucleoid-associated protein YgaU
MRWREIVALNKAVLNGKTVIYPNQWLQLPSPNA